MIFKSVIEQIPSPLNQNMKGEMTLFMELI